MKRRTFLQALVGFPAAMSFATSVEAGHKADHKLTPLKLSQQAWKDRLTEAQFYVLRDEGTERAFSSPLNDEKRKGEYRCAGCDLLLFISDTKYDSGTGWPSFYTAVKGHTGTKTDFKLIYPRTEYHCARCGGHQGHIFNDGPQPTGERWCNNGVALRFVPDGEQVG